LTGNDRLEPESFLSKLIACPSSAREALLEASADLEKKYQEAALRGNTSPSPAQDEVDLHYICFIKSSNELIYEMDGDAKGSIKTNVTLNGNEDILEAWALECVKQCIARENAEGKFSLLALVQDSS